MNTFNNFSPLAFREKSMKATYKKWYAYGKEFALPFSTTELPPFQFTVANLPSFDPNTVEVFLVNEATGVRGATGIKIKVDAMDGHGSVLYVSPGSNVYAESIEPGVYRAEFAIPEGETYVSTPICVTEGIETNTNFVKLEYWNDEKLAYPNGFVTTGTDNDFKFQMYIPTTFFKPKYEFEEEITKRAGYKFLELQTCNKVFGFNFLAPEYICDALRLVRLSDYIRFTHDGEYYNALNFEYNPDWQDNGYLAAIECQFETDTIIQKLPSFNRRDRESFYNALLADIDTPILFSPDVVGLYYREYKQGEPTIKGKLIRELSPIDLIDENTTIAVDMGAGEARKFNLYRMLEGYISKNHDDVTEFLLSLHAGVNVGTPNQSGEYPATIDRYGDAKFGNVDGGKSRFDSVETGFFTVNNTAATIDGMGNANVTDLTARGDSMLRSDVYTGFKNGSHTGKITKEGQLQYLSAIIYEFLSSETFVPGFLGEGFKIWVENGNWHIECDNLTVRQTMNIFELLIQKIRSVNGALVVSQSNGKIKSVSEDETNYVITMEEEGETFQPNDLVRCQVWTGSKTKFYWVEVSSVSGNSITVKKSEFTAGNKPEKGDEVVQMGNTQNAQRQALIYITAQESGHPYIEILNGVKTKSLSGTNRTRLGDLSNIQDSAFPEGQQPSGSGLYCDNAFLRGIFLLRNGKSVEDEVNQAKQDAANAATEAERAQQTAQEAKDRLNKWADDGFISPTEKPALIDEGKRIQAEFLQIKNNADKYGVPVPEYTKAYEDYLNELRYHSAQQPEDIAVRPELAKTQTIYYDRRNGALNAIANAAKSYVDEADKKLKEYLDTEITAIPGKIELAVRSLKVADVNLLKGAYKELKNDAYNVGCYPYDVPVVNGKEYTLTVCYTLSANNTHIEAYANGGTNFIANFVTKGDRVIESKKITMVGYKPGEGMCFFQFPGGTFGSKVHWAVLTDGNLGVTSWIPSASEKKTGIRNLFPLTRMTKSLIFDADFNTFKSSCWASIIYNNEETVSRFKPNTQYYIGFDYEILSLPAIGGGYYDRKIEFAFYNGSSAHTLGFVYPNFVVGEKGHFSNVFVTPSDMSNYMILCYTLYDSGNIGTVKFTNLTVVEGVNSVGWSQAPEDALTESIKYTDTQILAIDGKIELSVTTELNKRVIGGANLILKSGTCVSGVNRNVRFDMSKYFRDLRGKKVTISFDYEYSNLELGGNNRIGLEEPVLKDGTSEYYWVGTFKYFNSLSPKAEKGRFVNTITIPDDIVNSQNKGIGLLIQVGNSTNMKVCNPQIEIGDTATGWKPAPEDGVNQSIEYTKSQIGIVEGKITSTVEKINVVDGKVTGLASRVTQTEKSIAATAAKVDDQGRRLSAAELTLSADHAKLSVVETTANNANSLAGTANNKAEAADGRVTATQNGLVETGINIQSRKIVLKSDNVLFQNNAGQQTAAINANGKLTANAIEVGEVVAGGFAAQRITTGNLTVTDGAVIAGMSISGGVLRGSNVELTNGAKIGSFVISSGIFSAQDVPAGMQMSLSNNLSTFDSSGVKIDHNSGGYALTTNGNGMIYLKGSAFWTECQDYEFIGATSWKAPGVFYAASITASGSIYSTWGNPDFHITRVTLTATGEYTLTFTGNRGAVYPMVVAYGAAKWGNAFLTSVTSSEVRVKIVDVNSGAFNSNFFIYFCGMV